MNIRNLFLPLFLLGAVIGGVWLFYYEKQLPNVPETERLSSELLLKTQGANAAVNEAVLRSRENLDVSYDYLTAQTKLLENDADALSALSFQTDAPALEQKTNRLAEKIKNKIELIERFKSHNAVLKNSLRYAPVVGMELANAADSAGYPQLALLYSEAVNRIQHYAVTGEKADRQAFLQSSALLNNAERFLPDTTFSKQIEFTLHTRTVLQELPQLTTLISSIVTNNEDSEFSALALQWQRWKDAQQLKINRYYTYINVYIVYLVVGLLMILWWLRQVYRTLDRKVVERTKELEKAYDDLQQSQVQLVQSEKMALLGQMVAGVAHEVNTPLGYVKNNVTLIRDLVSEYDEIAEASLQLEQPGSNDAEILQNIRHRAHEIEEDGIREEQSQIFTDTLFGIEQIAELVINLKNFARLDEDKIKRVNICDCIESSLNIAKNQVKHFRIEKLYQDKKVAPVDCSPAQINQVLLNLFNNAVQAMDSDGKLIIDIGQNDAYVYIDVIDNGHGMDAKTKAKIFDPFFTTKSAGEGTGLGLAICRQIMEAHGGKIQVDSRLGKGTVFRISLPLVSQYATAAEITE